jgi:hypothetical protein
MSVWGKLASRYEGKENEKVVIRRQLTRISNKEVNNERMGKTRIQV